QGGAPEGIGIGLRSVHLQEIAAEKPEIAWLEVLADNFIEHGDYALEHLKEIASHYPVSLHSVSMSIGSSDPFDYQYLGRIKELERLLKPFCLSDHLCWSSVHGVHFHNLLPLPFTDETVDYIVGRVSTLQDFFGRRMAIENISSYLSFDQSTMSEAEFINRILERADCDMLLDVSNVAVTSFNNDMDALSYLRSLPRERVAYMHLGGFEDRGEYLLDTHSCLVADSSLDLYREALKIVGRKPTLLEWDNEIPELSLLLAEAQRIESHISDI
ncbi:MAG: hypothetical protein DCC75_11710, partial [Proteobacteria bacterium]